MALSHADPHPVVCPLDDLLRDSVGIAAAVRDLDDHLVNGRFDVLVDLVPLLGDDRDLADLVEQELGQPIQLGRVASRPAKTPKLTRTSIAGCSRPATMNAILGSMEMA